MTDTPAPQSGSLPEDLRLTPVEARVLGCLMEKQRTTPDAYPLTLNALVTACNQKTSREPVMHLQPGEVGHIVNGLRDRGLVAASFSGRAERYDHKMVSNYHLTRETQALLCALMLRGPQTLGELRINAGRMADLDDLETVQRALDGLAGRPAPLVMQLPKAPGQREDRYLHLLCGEPTPEQLAAPAPGRRTTLDDDRVAALEEEVAALRQEIEALWERVGR